MVFVQIIVFVVLLSVITVLAFTKSKGLSFVFGSKEEMIVKKMEKQLKDAEKSKTTLEENICFMIMQAKAKYGNDIFDPRFWERKEEIQNQVKTLEEYMKYIYDLKDRIANLPRQYKKEIALKMAVKNLNSKSDIVRFEAIKIIGDLGITQGIMWLSQGLEKKSDIEKKLTSESIYKILTINGMFQIPDFSKDVAVTGSTTTLTGSEVNSLQNDSNDVLIYGSTTTLNTVNLKTENENQIQQTKDNSKLNANDKNEF